MEKVLEFDAVIIKKADMDAAYVEVPFDIRALFGKSRLLVHMQIRHPFRQKFHIRFCDFLTHLIKFRVA